MTWFYTLNYLNRLKIVNSRMKSDVLPVFASTSTAVAYTRSRHFVVTNNFYKQNRRNIRLKRSPPVKIHVIDRKKDGGDAGKIIFFRSMLNLH